MWAEKKVFRFSKEEEMLYSIVSKYNYMPVKFDKKRVELSFRKFSDYASDVLSSNYHTFDTRFNILLNHCENDVIMSIISNQLKSIDAHFDEWWEKGMSTGGSFVGSKQFDLPVDETERDSLLYQFCLKINDRSLNFSRFCLDFFGATNFDEMVWAFNDAIVKPMVRSINYKLEEIMYDIKQNSESDQDIPIKFLYVYQDFSTLINGDVEISGDGAIGEGSKIEKKSII